MQARLLLSIAEALHCTGYYQRVYNSTRAESATIFGLRRHMERVEMLYSLLSPVMAAGAQTLRAESWVDSVVVTRRSFMMGFASTVGARLASAEETVAAGDGGYALALIDDRLAAEELRDILAAEWGLVFGAGKRSQRMFDMDAYHDGQRAGDMTDLGQTRVQARPALPF